MASEKNKRDRWRVIALVPLIFVTVANAQSQPAGLDAVVRQHERAVQDATAIWVVLVPRRLNAPQFEARVCLSLRGKSKIR